MRENENCLTLTKGVGYIEGEHRKKAEKKAAAKNAILFSLLPRKQYSALYIM